MTLERSRVTIRHASHAHDDLRFDRRDGSSQSWREPVQSRVCVLERKAMNPDGNRVIERAAGSESQQGRVVAGGVKGVRQQD